MKAIKSLSWNGHDLTIWVDTNTGTLPLTSGTGTENTSTIRAMIDGLHSATIAADTTGSVITNAELNDKRISAVSISGGAKKYADTFTKIAADGVLTFTDSTTVTAGESVDLYYMDDSDGDVFTDIRSSELLEQLRDIEASYKGSIDGIEDTDVSLWLAELEYNIE